MRAENTIQNNSHGYVKPKESSAWIATSCVPGMGFFTGIYRESALSAAISTNKNVLQQLEWQANHKATQLFRQDHIFVGHHRLLRLDRTIHRILADKVANLVTSIVTKNNIVEFSKIRSNHHIAGLVQNLLTVVLLVTLLATGIIHGTLFVKLTGGAIGLFALLALRNIYQIRLCKKDIDKFRSH
jgi:hypothetical protein